MRGINDYEDRTREASLCIGPGEGGGASMVNHPNTFLDLKGAFDACVASVETG